MGLGAVILGHADPYVNAAVTDQLELGVAMSLPHPLEVEVSELLVELIPCAEMVRFGKNGSDATSAAVRLARAYSGRDLIACCGYHGWQDWFIGTTTRNLGVPEGVQGLTKPFAYNDLESLDRIFKEHPGEVAAVIMEPVGVEKPKDDFLERVRDMTHRAGAILIFDEILTGFRFSIGGAQEFFGVIPDMACFGKAIANGFPLSAVVGRTDLMRVMDQIFFSSTFGGDLVGLSAARATLEELRTQEVASYLWRVGDRLKDGIEGAIRDEGLEMSVRCRGLSPRLVLEFSGDSPWEERVVKSFFQQECIRRGILFSGAHNLSNSHSVEVVDTTVSVYREVLREMSAALKSGTMEAQLNGAPVSPVFRQP
jgi:glutamate-1-semialdehyde 2,1-aminomutase/spore coat polysaccharide biosynthesis protein SpsF